MPAAESELRRPQRAPAASESHATSLAEPRRGKQAAVSVNPDNIVERAIAREPEAVRTLVGLLRPTIQSRVARALLRSLRGRTRGRSAAQEVEDMTQEVFLSLFDDDAKALRAWNPERLPLRAFVGMLAEHQVASIMRSGRRRPWREEDEGAVEPDTVSTVASEPESIVASNELLSTLLARMRAELSPKGLELFQALVVDEQAVEDVCAAHGMTRDAVYAWRSRLTKVVRKIAIELRGDDATAEVRRTGGTSR